MKTLYHVDHPDETLFDRINIETVERWKESELSGDEWRFSYVAFCYKKNVLLATFGGGSIHDAAAKAGAALYPIDLGPQEDFTANLLMTRHLCDQPGCSEPARVFYLRLKRYTKQGEELLRAGGDQYRQFCPSHSDRGDCALDDAMHNYERLSSITFVTFGEGSAYLNRREAHCSCGHQFAAAEDDIYILSRRHLAGAHGGGVIVNDMNIEAFLDDNIIHDEETES